MYLSYDHSSYQDEFCLKHCRSTQKAKTLLYLRIFEMRHFVFDNVLSHFRSCYQKQTGNYVSKFEKGTACENEIVFISA